MGGIGSVLGAVSGVLDMIPCTWRLVPIQMYSYSITKAPQIKIHSGAFWKLPIVEDLGTAPTQIHIQGFLDPQFGFIERPILEAMITRPGAGILSLPGKGILYCHCISAEFTTNISNIVDVSLEFVVVRSPLGTIGDLLGGSLPDSIGDSIASAQDSVVSDIGKFFA